VRVPTATRQHGLRFNITPLIDVVFLLVIFFLVASHFARSEPSETVELPDASQTTEDEEVRRLVITVQQDGRYSVSGQEVSLSGIEEMIRDGAEAGVSSFSVRIRGDRRTPFEFIEPIMLICPKHGITKFGFHVLER